MPISCSKWMPSPTAFRDIKMWKRFFNRFDNMKWFLFQQAFKLRARKQANSDETVVDWVCRIAVQRSW